MPVAHAVASGMNGLRAAGDLVARLEMAKGMRLTEAKRTVADGARRRRRRPRRPAGDARGARRAPSRPRLRGRDDVPARPEPAGGQGAHPRAARPRLRPAPPPAWRSGPLRARGRVSHERADGDLHTLGDVRGARDGAPRDGRSPAAHRPAAAQADRRAHPAQPRPAAGGAPRPRRRAHLARAPRPPGRAVAAAHRPAHAGRRAARPGRLAAAPRVRAARDGGGGRSGDRPGERGGSPAPRACA